MAGIIYGHWTMDKYGDMCLNVGDGHIIGPAPVNHSGLMVKCQVISFIRTESRNMTSFCKNTQQIFINRDSKFNSFHVFSVVKRDEMAIVSDQAECPVIKILCVMGRMGYNITQPEPHL